MNTLSKETLDAIEQHMKKMSYEMYPTNEKERLIVFAARHLIAHFLEKRPDILASAGYYPQPVWVTPKEMPENPEKLEWRSVKSKDKLLLVSYNSESGELKMIYPWFPKGGLLCYQLSDVEYASEEPKRLYTEEQLNELLQQARKLAWDAAHDWSFICYHRPDILNNPYPDKQTYLNQFK